MTDIPHPQHFEPADWQPHEYPLLFHYANFARLAESVNTEPGDLQGWFNRPLWRQYSYAPFNARVMENYYSLAFFYSYRAPWNDYYRNPEILRRLELALHYTFRLQDSRGALPEYAPATVDTPMLAPSSFGAEYLAMTLELAGEYLSSNMRTQLAQAAAGAARFVLSTEEAWTHAKSYSNQCFAAMVAALKVERLAGDHGLRPLIDRGLDGLLNELMAEPGYLYEANGPETFGYFFVSLSRLVPLYFEEPDPRILEVIRRHCDWLKLWLLPEPDGRTIFCAGSHQTRTPGREILLLDVERNAELAEQHTVNGSWPWLIHGIGRLIREGGTGLDPLKLFFPPSESLAQWQQHWTERTNLLERARKPFGEYQPAPLPYAYPVELASLDELLAARDALPCLDPTPRVQTLSDAHQNQFVLSRQTGYYIGFAFAERQTAATLGPAFLWVPEAGTLILSKNSKRPGWETFTDDGSTAHAVGLAAVQDEAAGPELAISYPQLGFEKFFSLRPQAINVRLAPDLAHGKLPQERIPLLLHETDLIRCDYGACAVADIYEQSNGWKLISRTLEIIRDGKALLRFDFYTPVPITLKRRPAFSAVGRAQVHTVAESSLGPDGPQYADVELTFRYGDVFYGRSGYQIAFAGE